MYPKYEPHPNDFDLIQCAIFLHRWCTNKNKNIAAEISQESNLYLLAFVDLVNNVSTMLWPCIISAIPFNWKLPWSQATCRKINFYQKRDVIPDCYCPFQLKVGFIQNLVRSADGYALGVVCNTKTILWKFWCDIPTCHQQ